MSVAAARPPAKVPLKNIFKIWFSLSIQSFGGGHATLALIRRAAVQNEAWVTDLEFTQYWALCQIAPGINLFALTILLGRKTGGAAGVAVALAGLALPSVTITILMTMLYARVRNAPATQAALNGLLPGTIGLGVVAAYQILRPLAVEAQKSGLVSMIVAAGVLVGSGVAVAKFHFPVIVALLGSGAICALESWLQSTYLDRRPLP